MRFKQYLYEEGQAHSFAELRPVTDDERALIKKCQELSRVIHDFLLKGKKIDAEDVKKFVVELGHFPDFKFLKHTIDELKKFLDAHEDMGKRAPHIAANIDKIKSSYGEMKKNFLAGTHKNAADHKESLAKILSKHDANIEIDRHASNHVSNRFTNAASIFGTTRFMERLDLDHYKEIHRIDTNGPLFTMYDFPVKMLKTDWDHIVYFLTQLKTEGGHVSFQYEGDFRKYMGAKNAGNEAYQKLAALMDKYLHSNDKDLIPEILEMIDKIPEIKAANEKRKKAITHVWRGVPGDFTEQELVDHDRQSKYVATSESLRAAKNFALQKGHLESERRSEVGYLIKYEVKPEAILFDTKIIATVFNESEVLIDATKALVTEIKEV